MDKEVSKETLLTKKMMKGLGYENVTSPREKREGFTVYTKVTESGKIGVQFWTLHPESAKVFVAYGACKIVSKVETVEGLAQLEKFFL